MQQEANLNSEKFAEAEKRFDDEKEERQNLDIKLKSLCAQLYESELRYKDALNQLQEKEIQYSKFTFIRTDRLKLFNDTREKNIDQKIYINSHPFIHTNKNKKFHIRTIQTIN